MLSAMSGGLLTLSDAREAGLGPWRLRTKAWQRIGPETYLPAGVEPTRELRIEAAYRRLPDTAVFSGFTAAWLHGLDVEPCQPIEITIPAPCNTSTLAGMKVRRRILLAGDTSSAGRYPVTSIVRTLHDLVRRLSLTEGIVLVDEALHKRLVRVDALQQTRWFARIYEYVEPKAESPMETRLRMVVVLGGLPRPLAQVRIYDTRGVFVGRPDLYYPEQRLGIEYDGAIHRSTLAEDNRRQNALLGAGVRLLRFTAADVLKTPERIVVDVSRELGIIPDRSVAMAEGRHPFPFRTRKLSPPAPMVLSG